MADQVDNSQDAEQNDPRRTRHLWRNPISLVGAVLAVVSFISILSIEFFDLISASANPYLGIWNYLILAPLFVVGGLLIPGGVFVTRWYWLRKGVKVSDTIRYPRIDLSNELHRKVLIRIGVMTVFMLPLIGLASSKTVHFSSSSNFCGNGCHGVMGPQYTRYLHSPHARVECSDCHVGPGAESLVKAKINGLRQVLSVMTNSYPHPIPPAILRLRPASETCGECHWAEKNFGDKFVERATYRGDEKNTRHDTRMLLKVGGGDAQTGAVGGIHWHMALGSVIEYSATGADLQNIPWVRARNLKTGESKVYRSDGIKGDEPPAQGVFRQLDCLDCHNRGAHKIEDPGHLVDVALQSGTIDATLPYIKREAIEAVIAPYASNEEGLLKIPERLKNFYQEHYPDVLTTKPEALQAAIEQISKIFEENFFIDMKVDWRTYPDNIGHKIFAGCFRCHDEKHVSAQGKTPVTDCYTCHEFLPTSGSSADKPVEFQHALLLGKGTHAKVTCRQCHTGGLTPAKQCDGACHQPQLQLLSGESPILKRFDIEGSEMFEQVDCDECHVSDRAVSMANIGKECQSCHEDDDENYEEMLAKWVEKVASQRTAVDESLNKLGTLLGKDSKDGPEAIAARKWLTETSPALEYLAKAGPLHNYKASKSVYKTVIEEAEEHIDALSKAKSQSEHK